MMNFEPVKLWSINPPSEADDKSFDIRRICLWNFVCISFVKLSVMYFSQCR